MSGSLLGRVNVTELLRDVDFDAAFEGTRWEGVASGDDAGERLGARVGEWVGSRLGALFGRFAGDLLVEAMLGRVGGGERNSSADGEEPNGNQAEANA